MSKISFRILMLLGSLTLSTVANAMVFDTREIPTIANKSRFFEHGPSYIAPQVMFSTASRAIGPQQDEIRLPEIFGLYDEGVYGQGLTDAGLFNPIPTEWQGHGSIKWHMDGKRQMQGFAFTWQQQINRYLSTGGSILFMHVNSRFIFDFDNANVFLGPGDRQTLDQLRRTMFDEVGLFLGNTSQTGFGDIDWYLRLGNCWEYTLKFKRIDAGISGGVIAPTGLRRKINQPASVPFGGDGHWGLYGAVDALFELKDDIRVGIYGRAQKRLPKTQCHRLPVNNEPTILGIVSGQARVNPGWTFILQPFVEINNLRPGLGINILYTLTHHRKDHWTDVRLDKTIPVQINRLEDVSSWGSDYVTLYVYYDFDYDNCPRRFNPIISFTWDIPALFYNARNVDKANRILWGVEFAYGVGLQLAF